MSGREPLLSPTPVADLRPTQITVGLHEVKAKRRAWRERSEADRAAYLGRHMIPVLKGPKDHLYVIDHHHLARALLDEGRETVLTDVAADLSGLSKSEFWVFCDNRGWCHPYDAEGERVGFDRIPKSLAELEDDPFRSLAGALRRAGGYAKGPAPYAEFTWADFLRRRVETRRVRHDFAAALEQALELARSPSARHLPGWCGPDAD